MERDFQRWTAKRKVELLLQLIRGEVKLVDVCREHDLKQSEVEGWMEIFVKAGERGLKLWQNYFWIEAHSTSRASKIRGELVDRDCLRLDYLCKVMFPRTRFLVILFDAEGTGEISLLRPEESARLEAHLRAFANVRMLLDRDEMRSFYTLLGPFDRGHPNQRQIATLAGRIGRELSGLAPPG